MNESQQKNIDAYAKSHTDKLAQAKSEHDSQLAQGANQYSSPLNKTASEHQKSLLEARRSNEQKIASGKNQHPALSKNNIANTLRNPGKLKGEIKEIAKSPKWSIAFALAISCDLADLIPFGGWVITLFFRPIVMVFFIFCQAPFLRKVVWTLSLFLDFIPFLGFLPGTTYCVYDAFTLAQEKKED